MTDAQIFHLLGLVSLAVGLGILANSSTYRQIVADYANSPASLYLGGLGALVVGFLLASSHPLLEANGTALLTILGWGALLKGLWILTLPHQAMRVTKRWIAKRRLATVHGFLVAALGALCLWLGFQTL